MIYCLICKKGITEYRRKVCGPECLKKHKAIIAKNKRHGIVEEPELTEDELREGYPYFYSVARPITHGKMRIATCLKCGITKKFRYGEYICPACHETNRTLGALHAQG